MQCVKKFLLLIPLLFCCSALMAAPWQPPLQLDPAAKAMALEGHMDWLKDADGSLTAQNAQAAPGWQALPGKLSAGFTPAAIWLRFELEQAAQAAQEWRLEVGNALLADVRFYQPDGQGGWRETRAGLDLAHSAWPLDTRSPTFRVLPAPGRQALMLRVQTRTALAANIRLWPVEQFHSHVRQEALAWGVYLGMYALLGLFQFIFWLWAREAISGWYLPYALMIFLLCLIYSGYLQNALDLPGGTVLQINGMTAALTLAMLGRFMSAQMTLPTLMPRLNRGYQRVTLALTVISFAQVLMGPFPHFSGGLQTIWMLWLLCTMGIVGLLWRRGHSLAPVFLWAFGIVLTGVVLRFLRNIGLLEPGLLTDYSFQLAALLHMMVICLYILYRYNALKQALELAQAARQEQLDFVAMVSHEFRTPLAIISTSAQQIANNLDAPPDKTGKRCGNIRAATRRMTALMDEYLSLDRIESDAQPLHLQPCDVAQELQAAAAERPPGRVQVTVGELPTHFVCDLSLLRIALHNLLTNADRHAPPDRPIELDARSDGQGGVLFRVTDHGVGIAEDERAQIFQKYFRGRSALRRPGAGLGLYLVRRIATLHGGHVTVSNAADGGAVFSLVMAETPQA